MSNNQRQPKILNVMATSTSVQPVPEATTGNSFDQFVTRRLDRAGVQVKMVDLATGFLLIATVVLGILLTVCVIDGWIVTLGTWFRMAILLGLSAFTLIVLIRSIAPLLLRRINPAYAARMIEQGEPKFKNSLLNYVYLKSRPNANSKRIFEAVQAKAAQDLSAVAIESAIDRSRLIQVGFALVALALASGLYKLVSPKDPFATVARVMAPLADIPSPSRVRIPSVEPGSVDVFFGETIDVVAVVRGAGDTPVFLTYSTDDGQRVNARIPLEPSDTKNEFVGRLTTSDAGIQQSLSYWVVAGDGRSSTYHVDVRPSPTIAVSKISLTPPKYTELPTVSLTGQADLESIEGTNVHLEAIANQDIATASLELLKAPSARKAEGAIVNATGLPRRETQVEKQLEFQIIDRVPMATVDRAATVDFKLLRIGDEQKFTHYRLKFTSREGQRNRVEPVHAVRIKPDLAPEIEVLEPSQTKLQVPVNGTLRVNARALDPDFRITAIRMIGLQKGKTIVNQNLVLDQPAGVGNVLGSFDFRPEAVGLAPGDEVIFHLAAVDNRKSPLNDLPDPNVTRSANYELRIAPPTDSGDPSRKRRSESSKQEQGSLGDTDQSEPSKAKDKNKDESMTDVEGPGKPGPPIFQQEKSQAGGNKSESQSSEDSAQPSEDASGGGKSNSNNKNKSNQRADSGNTEESNADSPESDDSNSEPSPDGRSNESSQSGAPKSGEPNTTPGGNSAESSKPPSPGEKTGSDDARGSGRQADAKSSDDPSSEKTDSQSNQSPSEDSSESASDLAGEPTETSNDSANGNPSDGSQRQPSDGGNPQTDRHDQAAAGDPKENSRPLDQASHDGDRFEKLLDHIQSQKEKTDKSPGQSQSSEQSLASDEARDQQSSRTQESNAANSKADSEHEPKKNSETGDPSDEGTDPSDSASGEQSNSKLTSESKGDSPDQKSNDARNPSPQSQANDGNSDSESADAESPDPSGEKTPGESTEQDSAGAEEGAPASNSKSDSESSGNNSQTGDDKFQGAQPIDASPEDSKADSQPRPRPKSTQFPDSATNPADRLNAKFDTPEEREILERSRKVTDLVVDYLKDQQHKPDRALLDEMNWTEQELRDFVARWEHLKQAASQGESNAGLRYSEALRSLGLRSQTAQARRAQMQRDQIRDLNEDGSISRPPGKFAEAFRDFSKGRARRDYDQ